MTSGARTLLSDIVVRGNVAHRIRRASIAWLLRTGMSALPPPDRNHKTCEVRERELRRLYKSGLVYFFAISIFVRVSISFPPASVTVPLATTFWALWQTSS